MPIIIKEQIKPQEDISKFPIVDAEYISYLGSWLSEFLPVVLTQEEYDALEEKNPHTPYFIIAGDTE